MAPRAPQPDQVRVSSAGKVLFPGAGFTKADLVDYYVRVAEVMVPHIKGRPVSMQVFPGGIAKGGHFAKQAPDYFPGWVGRVTVPKKGGTVTHPLADSAAALAVMANHNSITPHVWTSRADRLDRPDRLIVDLDPSGGDEDFPRVRAGALLLREIYESAGLAAFVMTTGSRGLHVVAPLRREAGFEAVLELAREIARVAVAAQRDDLTSAFMKDDRDDKVFVDVLRNRWAQTAVPPYAVRPRPGAPVAAPIEWPELEDPQVGPRSWNLASLPERLARHGDPWAEIGSAAASPRSALKRAKGL